MLVARFVKCYYQDLQLNTFPFLRWKYDFLVILLKIVSTTFLPVCFSSLKKSTCETWKIFFIFLQKLFSFSGKLRFYILDI